MKPSSEALSMKTYYDKKDLKDKYDLDKHEKQARLKKTKAWF